MHNAAALSRLREFGDDWLSLTAELWRLIGAGGNRDPVTAARGLREGLEGLRTAIVGRYQRLYVQASAPESAAAMPWFGPWRLHQESHGELVAATTRSQRAVQRFGGLLTAVAEDAFARLLAALVAADASASAITSLRELHNFWVDCGEQAYANAAQGEEFAAALVELMAATVELRSAQQRLAEEWSRACGLPTRSQVDAIGERLHALHRRILALESDRARYATPP